MTYPAVFLTLYLVWLSIADFRTLSLMVAKTVRVDSTKLLGACIGILVKWGIIFSLLYFGGFYGRG